jgi:hypothetical protein
MDQPNPGDPKGKGIRGIGARKGFLEKWVGPPAEPQKG